MTIGLLHPSRGRAQKSFGTVMNWIKKVNINSGIKIIVNLSLDSDDPQLSLYVNLYKAYKFEEVDLCIHINRNTSVVEATNIAAQRDKESDIFIYLSDDFDCPSYWDWLISTYFTSYDFIQHICVGPEMYRPVLLKVDDCLQKFEVPVLTIPIMNRALYNQLGYFWHPAYKSMFVDCDLYEVCKKLGALRLAPELKFPHLHHSIGKCENDETYRASEVNWAQGETIFRERRAKGFPIL